MKSIIITTADNMSDKTYNYICDRFRAKFGPDIDFRRITDNGIIGGFIADVDGKIYDLSISSQLKQMKEHLVR